MAHTTPRRATRARVATAGIILVLAVVAGCAALVASASFDVAVAEFERGDYRAAAARLEETLHRGADSARVRTLLGWCYYRLDEHARARSEFERSLQLDASDPNAYYAYEGLGWIALRAGDQAGALRFFAEALRLSPGYHNAHVGLGWTYLDRQDLVRAAASFDAALKTKPGDRDARRGLAFVAYRRGDWTAAIHGLRSVLREDEGDTLSRSALAWAHYYKGELDAARPLFEDLARREPRWADPWLGFGWIAERQGRRAEAREHFRTAIQKAPTYVASGVVGPALRELLGARPEWPDLWRDLGWALYHARSFALAEAEFALLLRRHPDDADGARGLGYALYALKRYRDAIPPLERSLAAKVALPPIRERVEIPGTPGLHAITTDATSTLAWAHYHTGNLAAAIRLFGEATTAHASWPDAWSGLGWALTKRGDRAGAEAAFRRALTAQPGYPDARTGLQQLGRRTP